jgi:hypothetical protein
MASISGNTVTVTVNGPAPAQTRAFTVTPTTWVHATPPRGSVQALAAGDRVIVYTIGNSTDATAIVLSHVSRSGMGMMMGGGYHLMGDEA